MTRFLTSHLTSLLSTNHSSSGLTASFAPKQPFSSLETITKDYESNNKRMPMSKNTLKNNPIIDCKVLGNASCAFDLSDITVGFVVLQTLAQFRSDFRICIR